MFGWARRRQEPRSLIDVDSEIQGPVRSRGFLEIRGLVTGDVAHDGALVIAAGGSCLGRIHAAELTIAGEVVGDVVVTGLLRIRKGGRLLGDAACGGLAIDVGGTFQGRNRLQDPAEAIAASPLAVLMAPVDAPRPPVDVPLAPVAGAVRVVTVTEITPAEAEEQSPVAAEEAGHAVAEGPGDAVAEGPGDAVAEGTGDVVAEGPGDAVAEILSDVVITEPGNPFTVDPPVEVPVLAARAEVPADMEPAAPEPGGSNLADLEPEASIPAEPEPVMTFHGFFRPKRVAEPTTSD